jgi:hypothetical protein
VWSGATLAADDLAGSALVAVATRPSLEVVSVNLTAEGFMIDLRYRVTTPESARAMLDQKVHPTLVREATGERFTVPSAPKLGTLRQTTRGGKQAVDLDSTYFMLFSNQFRRLQVGDRVTLIAGDAVVEHLVVGQR